MTAASASSHLQGNKEGSLVSPGGHTAPEGECEARAGVWMPVSRVLDLTHSEHSNTRVSSLGITITPTRSSSKGAVGEAGKLV